MKEEEELQIPWFLRFEVLKTDYHSLDHDAAWINL